MRRRYRMTVCIDEVHDDGFLRVKALEVSTLVLPLTISGFDQLGGRLQSLVDQARARVWKAWTDGSDAQ